MAGWRTPVWFDRKTDTINIDHTYTDGFTISAEEGVQGIGQEPGLQTLACDSTIPLSVHAELFEPRGSAGGQTVREPLPQWMLKRVTQRRQFDVVLATGSIHLTHQQACASGLFGPFAEETTIHVCLNDDDQLRRLFAAYGSDSVCRTDVLRQAWIDSNSLVGFVASLEPKLSKFLENVENIDALRSKQNRDVWPEPGQSPEFRWVIAIYRCGDGSHSRQRKRRCLGRRDVCTVAEVVEGGSQKKIVGYVAGEHPVGGALKSRPVTVSP